VGVVVVVVVDVVVDVVVEVVVEVDVEVCSVDVFAAVALVILSCVA
jgi:hypothetical protein